MYRYRYILFCSFGMENWYIEFFLVLEGGGRFFRIDELRVQLCFVYILYQHVRVMLIKSDWGLSTIHVELICKEIWFTVDKSQLTLNICFIDYIFLRRWFFLSCGVFVIRRYFCKGILKCAWFHSLQYTTFSSTWLLFCQQVPPIDNIEL